jgi:murein DD-endopeptidase MepM/ murein hydrolase activator NlpD
MVEISHNDGSMSRYGHNSNLLVRQGQLVEQGQVISQMGSTGRSTGPHLHFEIHPAGEGAMNPLLYLPPRA